MSVSTGRYCGYCGTRVFAQSQQPNHLLHLFLTLFSCGMWSVVWFLLTLARLGKYRCTKCGGEV